VWRLSRRVDPAILRQVSEAEVGPSVGLKFRATGIGTASVALTRGDKRVDGCARSLRLRPGDVRSSKVNPLSSRRIR
jgi:hypothetical protein